MIASYLVVLVMMIHQSGPFNVGGRPYQIWTGSQQEDVGASIVIGEKKLFVGVPKSNSQYGRVYACNLDTTGKNVNLISPTCSEINPTLRGNKKLFRERGQGFGSHLYLNPSKRRLLVCAPRASDLRTQVCKKDYKYIEKMVRLQGTCTEYDTTTFSVMETRNWCSAWKKGGTGTYYLKAFGKQMEPTCAQFQLYDSATARFNSNGASFTLEDLDSGTTYKVNSSPELKYCPGPYQVLMSYQNGDNIDVYCLTPNSTKFVTTVKLPFTPTTSFSVTNVAEYRENPYYKTAKDEREMRCLLGMGAVYFSDADLALAAPGYGRASSSVRLTGAILTGPEFDQQENPKQRYYGMVYTGIKHVGNKWEAIKSSSRVSLRDYVDIRKNGETVHNITEFSRFTSFGRSLLFYPSGNELYLLVGSPFSSSSHDGGNTECGRVYVYKLHGSTFTEHQSLRPACGWLGMTMVNIGKIIPTWSHTQVAVSAPQVRTIVVLSLGDDGMFKAIQLIEGDPDISSNTTFGFSLSGGTKSPTESVLAVSDPMRDRVFLYKTLPIVKATLNVNCETSFNIVDMAQGLVCLVGVTSDPATTFKENNLVKVSWKANHTIVSPHVTLSTSLRNLTVGGEPQKTTFNISTSLNETSRTSLDLIPHLLMSFTMEYEDFLGRTVAFDPEYFYQEKVLTTDLVGYCGDKQCEADFKMEHPTPYVIRRTGETENFKSFRTDNRTIYLDCCNGSQEIDIPIRVTLLSGKFMKEEIRVVSPDGLKYTRTTTVRKNATVWEVNVTLTVVGVLEPLSRITVDLILFRNRDPRPGDNTVVVTIPMLHFIYFHTKSLFEPRAIPPKLERYIPSQFDKKSTSTYGPTQDLHINVVNLGVARAPYSGRVHVSIMYPVLLRGAEVFYITEIWTEGRWYCTDETTRKVDYRRLGDPSSEETQLGTVPCTNTSWDCVQLECLTPSLLPTPQGQLLIIRVAVDLEAAHAAGKFDFKVQYNVTVNESSGATVGSTYLSGNVSSNVHVLFPLKILSLVVPAGGAAVAAIIILIGLVYGLNRCGFFERKHQLKMARRADFDEDNATSDAKENNQRDAERDDNQRDAERDDKKDNVGEGIEESQHSEYIRYDGLVDDGGVEDPYNEECPYVEFDKDVCLNSAAVM